MQLHDSTRPPCQCKSTTTCSKFQLRKKDSSRHVCAANLTFNTIKSAGENYNILPIHIQILHFVEEHVAKNNGYSTRLRNVFWNRYRPEYSMTSSGDFPSTSRAILSISSRPYFSLALINWLKSLLFQFVKPCKHQEIRKLLLSRKETFCKILSYVSFATTANASAMSHN